MKNRTKIFVRISASISNFCFLLLISLLFVCDIDYRQFFAVCVNYQYRFAFVFRQHRLPTLTWNIREAKRARQFNPFNDFWILAINCSYSYYVNHKNRPAAGGSAPPLAHSVLRMSCNSLFDTGHKLDNFSAKNFTFNLNPLPLSKILLALLVAFIAADRFIKRLYAVLQL